MTLVRSRLLGAGFTAALAGGTLLVTAPAAHAEPPFSDAGLYTNSGGYGSSGPCALSSGSAPNGQYADITPDGGPATGNYSVTRTFTANGDPTDTIDASGSIHSSASLTTSGGRPKSAALSFSATVSATASKGTSPTCSAYTSLDAGASFAFTLTTPMWATIALDSHGPARVAADIDGSSSAVGLSVDLEGLDGPGSATALLPAGSYYGSVYGSVGQRSNTAFSASASGSATVTFAPITTPPPPGSATKAPSGKATKYVALPGARTCATHNATATLTTKKKALKQIQKVTFAVNGKKAATLKDKLLKKGQAVALPLADNTAADITATVRLKNGKKRTVDAAYLACTS